MTPYELATRVYKSEPCARTFEEDLALHLRWGVVLARPDFFIMGRPVWSKAPPAQIVNPAVRFEYPVQVDCWHVYLAAGNLARAWDFLPFPLPLMSFERKNDLRFYSLERLRSLYCGT